METQLARFGAILLIAGFLIQIIGYLWLSLSPVLFDGDNGVYPTNLYRVSNSDNDDNNL